jgi:hypothetical protein
MPRYVKGEKGYEKSFKADSLCASIKTCLCTLLPDLLWVVGACGTIPFKPYSV